MSANPHVELKPFEREERYIVIKRKHLTNGHEAFIRGYLEQIGVGIVEGAVVERDWPEYETVWSMIEARVLNLQSADALEAATPSEREKVLKRAMVEAVIPLEAIALTHTFSVLAPEMQQGIARGILAVRTALEQGEGK